KPSTLDKLLSNIENPVYRDEGDFSKEEKIILKADLTKLFPLRDIVSQKMEDIMKKYNRLPISDWCGEKGEYWFVTKNCIVKKDRGKRKFYLLEVLDSSYKTITIKCWNIKEDLDVILPN